jgi:hypothetical protein
MIRILSARSQCTTNKIRACLDMPSATNRCRDSIAYQQIVKVKEDRRRFFERDAVPGHVGGCLAGIPFEISKRYRGHDRRPEIVASPGAISRSHEADRGVASEIAETSPAHLLDMRV